MTFVNFQRQKQSKPKPKAKTSLTTMLARVG